MLVPFRSRVPRPASTCTDLIATPGAETWRKALENGAMVSVDACGPSAPTETTPSAAARREAAIS